MEPLSNNDDDLLIYCDWLEDEGKSQEAEDLREDILEPNVDSWYAEVRNYSQTGSGGSPSVGGSGSRDVGVRGRGFKGVGGSVGGVGCGRGTEVGGH